MTNILDGLIAKLDDPAMRDAIATEVDHLREIKDFGLVFERHLPETMLLRSHPIKRGLMVQERDSEASPHWLVKRVSAGAATLVARDGRECERPVEELVVIRDFGDPIFPGLRLLGEVNRGGAKPAHTVINGDNYHALEALLYCYAGQVDCIYIDPPFNSGARDWKYNNHYVDDDDTYRHSKWLSFMEKRLSLAKRLLNPADSVIIVAIDENENHRLALLLREIFRGSKLQMVTVLINPAGANIIDQFSRVDEQLLFVHVGAARPIRTVADTTPLPSVKLDDAGQAKPKKFQWESLQRSGGNSRREDTKAKFFPVYIHETNGRIIGCGDHLPEGVDRATAPPPPDGCIQQWPIKKDRSEACWQVSAPTFRRYLAEGRIRLGRKKAGGGWGMSFLTSGHMTAIEKGELTVLGRDEGGALTVEATEGRARTKVGKTMWINGAYSATEHGSTLLRKFIPGRKFPFPKSLYAVEDALRFYVGNKPEALILDFFAGSGTTAHAVARLNHQDDGHRRCVSVTNNEVSEKEGAALRARGLRPGDKEWEALGIFEYITRPRIEAAITGRTLSGAAIDGSYRFIDEFPMSEGFSENVEFYELTYLDPDEVSRGAAFAAIAPLLYMKAGATRCAIPDIAEPFAIPTSSSYGILFDIGAWRRFAEELDRRPDVTHAFVVTDSAAQYQQVVASLPPTVDTRMLYEDYLRNFETSAGAPR